MRILNFEGIDHLIDDNGAIITTTEAKEISFRNVENLAESYLGCTLHIRGKSFIIRMVELYYGSGGDDCHDWFRCNHGYKKSNYLDRTQVQFQKGPRIYISSPDLKDPYTRMDIVIGEEGVAASLLIRSVWTQDFTARIGASKGSPNIVLNAMGIVNSDHGFFLETENESENSIWIEDTHDFYFNSGKLLTPIRVSKRINLKSSSFEEVNNLSWNFCAEVSK